MKSITTYVPSVIFCFLLLTLGNTEADAQKFREILLSGYKQKPVVATSGTAYMTLELTGDTLKISGEFNNLTGQYRGASLMAGKPNQPGNQLYRLKATVDTERLNGTFNVKENLFELNEAQKALLKNGELFLLITSSEYPHGELRGQIPPME